MYKEEPFWLYVLDMFDLTRPDSLEHMAFHFTLQALERGDNIEAYLRENIEAPHKPEIYEAYDALWRRWLEVKAA